MEYGNLSFNYSTMDVDVPPQESRKIIIHEIIFFMFATVAFCADVAIIFIMLYYKKMRTASNIYIANWAILDICSLIMCPSGYRILSVIENISLSRKFLCFLFQASAAVHMVLMLAVIITVFDWLIAAFFSSSYKPNQSYQKYVIGIQWILIVVLCCLLLTHCESLFLHEILACMLLFFTFLGIGLIVIVMYIAWGIKRCMGKQLTYPSVVLYLATGFVVCYFLALLNILLLDFYRLFHPTLFVISACLVFSDSTVNFIILYLTYKNFRFYINQTIKCLKNRKQEDILEFNNEGYRNYDEEHDIQVSFDNPTQKLSTNMY